jgi:hypothetical protein
MNKLSILDIVCMVVLGFLAYIVALILIFSGYGIPLSIVVGLAATGILLWRWHRVMLSKLANLVKPVDPA